MATHEGELAGLVGSVEPIGDEFDFNLWTREGGVIGTFVFQSLSDARRAAKLLKDIVACAVAVTVPVEHG